MCARTAFPIATGRRGPVGRLSGRFTVPCSFACHVVKRSWPPVVLMSAFGVKSLPDPQGGFAIPGLGEARPAATTTRSAASRRDLPGVVVAVAVRQVRREVHRRQRAAPPAVRSYAVIVTPSSAEPTRRRVQDRPPDRHPVRAQRPADVDGAVWVAPRIDHDTRSGSPCRVATSRSRNSRRLVNVRVHDARDRAGWTCSRPRLRSAAPSSPGSHRPFPFASSVQR